MTTNILAKQFFPILKVVLKPILKVVLKLVLSWLGCFSVSFETGVLKWLRWQKLLKWVGLLKIGGKGTKEKMK